MTTEQRIINYLNNISKGKVSLKQNQAAAIIDLVLNAAACRVILYRYSLIKGDWEVMRTVTTDQETIDRVMQESLKHKPVQDQYRYDLYNEVNELQGYIYSLNSVLF